MWRCGAVATADALNLGLVVFDITGTVITNTGAVADAFLSALRRPGLSTSLFPRSDELCGGDVSSLLASFSRWLGLLGAADRLAISLDFYMGANLP